MKRTKKVQIPGMHPGISSEEQARQMALFAQGVAPATLDRPCVPADGIRLFEDPQVWADAFDERQPKTVKFVPASGAASRMFKHVFSYAEDQDAPLNQELVRSFRALPFYGLLKERLETQGCLLDEWINTGNWQRILQAVIGPEGMGYASVPKGLVHFHEYPEGVRTAFEEHLVEAAMLRSHTPIHFTVPTAHLSAIQQHVSEAVSRGDVGQPALHYSVQFPETDTVCVDLDNKPVRGEDGQPVYRPGGHGALIHNLATLDADVVFIKNIDNVQPDRLKPEVIRYKKAIAGLLLHVKDELDQSLQAILEGKRPSEKARMWLGEMGYDADKMDAETLRNALDRPLRVCGMVRNEGEPGGGPFWVRDGEGRTSAQIVEKAEIDLEDPVQAAIAAAATHFNPVDLACAFRRFDGSKYDLQQFVDPGTSFISQKSIGGRPVKALEHPGLWNGAMARWNTLFVEVPGSTFSPVKTVNDLLRPAHQV